MRKLKVVGIGAEMLRNGRYTIYNKWIRENKGLKPGEIVLAVDNNNAPLAVGFYEPWGAMGFRKICDVKEWDGDIESYFRKKVTEAYRLRQKIVSENAYRLVNSEGDFLSGWIVDVYNDIAVIQPGSGSLDLYVKLMARIVGEITGVDSVMIRADQKSRRDAGLPIYRKHIWGKMKYRTIIKEGEARFIVDTLKGQKTGFFLDQSANRKYVARFISPGSHILDLFSYTGGFGIHAALRGGEVTLVEESEIAVSMLYENLQLNGIKNARIYNERVEEFMSRNNERFDIVIADPPAYIPRPCDKKKGIHAYLTLARSIREKVVPGSMVFFSSCSTFLSSDELLSIISRAFGKVKLIGGPLGASPSHVSRPQDLHLRYLKGFLFEVQ